MNAAHPVVVSSLRRKSTITRLATAIALLLAAVSLASAQNFSIIHTFANQGDGADPAVGLTLDVGGNLYGTTGVAFKMKRTNGSWVLTPLATLAFVSGLPTFGPDGSLYVATVDGGLYQGECWETGCGTVRNLRPQATVCGAVRCDWNVRTLYGFTDGSDGLYPNYTVAIDAAGNIYGTAESNAWELTRSGSGYNFSVIYNFGPQNLPFSGPILDAAGNLYGTTAGGGDHNQGAVYKLSRSGSGWTYSVLYSFRGQEDGSYPHGGLVFDGAGNLYGASNVGGAGNGGAIFELSPSGGGWNYALLYSLSAGNPNGGQGVSAALSFDAAGNLYGTTDSEGSFGYGNVFKLTPGPGGWTYSSLHDFTGGNDGNMWYSAVTPAIDTNGNVYGTASIGGANNFGTVWQITQ